jgi:type II secretory pathway component PulF
MARFQYTATDSDGKSVTGFVESGSPEQALKELVTRGLEAIEIEPASDEEKSPVVASSSAAQTEAISQAGQLIAAGVPLSAGLRALAEESGNRPICRVLSQMADRLEAGDDLKEVFSDDSVRLPAYLKGLVHAGTQMGDLAGGIEHYVQFSRLRSTIQSRVRVSLAYPLTLFLIGAVIAVALLYFLMPQFRVIFDDFGVELPDLTMVMLDLSSFTVAAVEVWPVTIAVAFALPFIIRAIVRNVIGPAAWRRTLYCVPLFGPTLRYGALAEYCHLLAILIDHHIPLPEALKLAGDGVSDWNLREGSYLLSQKAEAGDTPGQGQDVPHFPRDVLNLMSWGLSGNSDGQSPGDVVRGAGEIYVAHAEVHSRTITAAIEPVAILMVALMVAMFVVSMFLPLMKLLNDLS